MTIWIKLLEIAVFYTSKIYTGDSDNTKLRETKTFVHNSVKTDKDNPFKREITDAELAIMSQNLLPIKNRKRKYTYTTVVLSDTESEGSTHSSEKPKPNQNKEMKPNYADHDSVMNNANSSSAQNTYAKSIYDEKKAIWEKSLIDLYERFETLTKEEKIKRITAFDFSKYAVIVPKNTALEYEEFKEGLNHANDFMCLIRPKNWAKYECNERISNHLKHMFDAITKITERLTNHSKQMQYTESLEEQQTSTQDTEIRILEEEIQYLLLDVRNNFKEIVDFRIEKLKYEKKVQVLRDEYHALLKKDEYNRSKVGNKDKPIKNCAEEKSLQDQIIAKTAQIKSVHSGFGGTFGPFYSNVAYINATREIFLKKQELIYELKAQNTNYNANITSQPQ